MRLTGSEPYGFTLCGVAMLTLELGFIVARTCCAMAAVGCDTRFCWPRRGAADNQTTHWLVSRACVTCQVMSIGSSWQFQAANAGVNLCLLHAWQHEPSGSAVFHIIYHIAHPDSWLSPMCNTNYLWSSYPQLRFQVKECSAACDHYARRTNSHTICVHSSIFWEYLSKSKPSSPGIPILLVALTRGSEHFMASVTVDQPSVSSDSVPQMQCLQRPGLSKPGVARTSPRMRVATATAPHSAAVGTWKHGAELADAVHAVRLASRLCQVSGSTCAHDCRNRSTFVRSKHPVGCIAFVALSRKKQV